jgi:hypothetical protein
VRLLIARPNVKGLQDPEMRSHAAENDAHNLPEYEAGVVLQDQSDSFLRLSLVINVRTVKLYSVESIVSPVAVSAGDFVIGPSSVAVAAMPKKVDYEFDSFGL